MRAFALLLSLTVAFAATPLKTAVVEGAGYFPVLIKLKSGEAVAVLRGAGAHVGRQGNLALVTSRDRGKTWSPMQVVVDGPEDDRNPAFGQLADGTLLLAYAILSGYDESALKLSRDRSQRAFDGVYLMRSRDNGKTWTQSERSQAIYDFYGDPSKAAVSPYGKIVQLKDGTVLMAVYFEFFDARGHESYVFRSTDGGRTWGDPDLIGKRFNETALAVLTDGTVLAAMRSEKGAHLAVTRSADKGRTWSAPAIVTKDNEHPGDLIVLRDGRVVLAHGVRNPPRGAAAILSRDGGKTWNSVTKVILADDASNTDCGYPSSIELGNGKILTVYYQVDDAQDAPRSAKAKAVIWDAPR